jgi:hypothetical protein
LAQHGTQVALATILSTEVYRKFLTGFEPAEVDVERCYPAAEQMQARIRAAFNSTDPSGQIAAECWSDYRQKLESWHQHRRGFEAFLHDWPRTRTKVQSLMRPPELAARILREVDSPLRFDQLTPPVSAKQVKFAFLNAPLFRRRLTIGDLLVFLNWDTELLWKQVWATSQRLGTADG